MQSIQQHFFALSLTQRQVVIIALCAFGTIPIALFIGIVGPILALAFAIALIAGVMMLVDTHWGFVALCGVLFGLPFASLPASIGFKPTFLDLALAALFFVWLLRLVTGQERELIASPLGTLVGLFVFVALFAFAYGMTHSAANSYFIRRFGEIVLGILLFFVAINTVRTVAELRWVTGWLMLTGWMAAAIAVLFYFLPTEITASIFDRLVRFDYPGGFGALRWIEDDPNGTMRAIGTAVDPNVLGGMMILVAGLMAPQLFAERTIFPRWLTVLMLLTSLLALYLTYSRSALLGIGASLGLLALLKYRRLIPLGLVAVALLFLLPQTQEYVARLLEGLAGEDQATLMRFGEYKDALILIQRYPFFGVGFTGVPDLDIYLGVSMLYLIIAENMGLIGLAIFLATMAGFFILMGSTWRQGVSNEVEAILLGLTGAVLGALVSGVFDHYWFNLTYPHMTVLLWLYVGLATAVCLVSNPTPPTQSPSPLPADSPRQPHTTPRAEPC